MSRYNHKKFSLSADITSVSLHVKVFYKGNDISKYINKLDVFYTSPDDDDNEFIKDCNKANIIVEDI